MEQYFENLANLQKNDVLLVCDRGTCDTFAYCTPEVREAVLKKEGWDFDFLNHNRYDRIIHLVTAANGACCFYGLGNNEARSEGIKEGIDLDRKIQEVWFTHPRYSIIDNTEKGFQNKIERVFTEVGDVIQRPTSKFVRKFLLKHYFDLNKAPENIILNPYKETITYLPKNTDGSYSFLVHRQFKFTTKQLHVLKTRSACFYFADYIGIIIKLFASLCCLHSKFYKLINESFANHYYSLNIYSKNRSIMQFQRNLLLTSLENSPSPNHSL